jgi:hypothetical protein
VAPNANDIYYGPTGTLGGNVAVGTVVTTTLGGSNNFIAGGNVYVARQHFGNASDTLTTPSYSWLGAPTTGLYRQASNVVAFTSNGIDQLRIGPQSLGIGSTNSQVNVRGDLTLVQGGAIVPSTSTSSADGVHGIIWSANPGGASGGAWIKWYQGGFSTLYTTLEIGTGSDTHDILYFNTSGKVGFGVAVPSYKIDVSGDINVSGTYYVNGVALGGGSGTVTSIGMTVPGFLSVTPASITTSGTFAISLSGTALPVANGGTGLTTAPTNGQIDIGSTGLGFTRTTLTAGSGVSITNGAGAITIAATGSGGTVTSISAGQGVTLSPNPITTTGTVSIGQSVATTATPTFNGLRTTGQTDALISSNYDAAGRAICIAASVSGTQGILQFTNNAVSVQWASIVGTSAGLTINATTTAYNGAITATGEITAYSSDARLKQNVTNIDSALNKLSQINGVMFDWDTAKAEPLGFNPKYTRDVGVIAQEIQAVLPEAVRPAPFDRSPDGTGSASGEHYLTVQYEKLTALLIEAVKELKAEVNELKARLDGQ